MLSNLQARVLSNLEACGGQTDEEGYERMTMRQNTYRPRRIELVSLGLVKDSGWRKQTHSGRFAIIWRAV